MGFWNIVVSNAYLASFMFRDEVILKTLIDGSVTSHLYHD